MRERMAQHRANPACAGCHALMDPVGFSMENYDAVGRWRTDESGQPIDAAGGLPDGSKFDGVAGLQKTLLSRPEAFVNTMTEKLLTYSLGRGVEYYDAPAVRKIVSRQQREGLPFFVSGFRNCEQYAVSDEECTMIVTKKALPRRTFLRGVGTALSLPLLDAMAPAMTAVAAQPAASAKRIGFLYVPMGAHRPMWNVPGDDLTQLSPTLTPLANVRDYCTVVDNLELRNAYPGTHATSNSAFLSAAKSKWTESSDYYLGTTVDQVAAKQLGLETRLPSLEMSMDLMAMVGQCDNGYACVYQNNLSWSSPTTPLPSEAHPRLVFERLFGDGGTSSERLAEMRKQRKPARLDEAGYFTPAAQAGS